MARIQSPSRDVVIVGAGIAGIATAWALAEHGARNVVIVDPRPPLSFTSRRPEASYRTWWPSEPMIRLATRSLALIDGLRADGAWIPMDRRGYLYVSDDPARIAGLPGVVATHPATAVSEAVALDRDEIHRRWPHLAATVGAGIFVGRAGSIDAVALGQAMLDRAVRRGVRVIRGEVTEVARAGGRIEGIALRGQVPVRMPADVLVDAAGPFARVVARLAGSELPLETVLRQKVLVRDIHGVVPRDAPFTITLDGRSLPWSEDERRRLAADPRTRRLLGPLPPGIHAKPDPTGGPDALKLGWAWDQTPSEPTADPACPPAFPRMALLGASTVIPGLAAYLGRADDAPAAVAAHHGGFYARTPDGLPLIGRVGEEAPSGLFAVAGLAGFGVMMGAGAGDLAARAILGAEAASGPGDGAALHGPALLGSAAAGELGAAFEPSRFADPTYVAALGARTFPTGEL